MDASHRIRQALESIKDTTFTKSGVEKEWNDRVFEEKFDKLKLKFFGEELPAQVTTAKLFLNWFVGADMGPTFDLTTLFIKTLGFFSHSAELPLLNILKPKGNESELLLSLDIGFQGKVEKLDLSREVSEASYFATAGHAIVGTSFGKTMPGTAGPSSQDDQQSTTTLDTVKAFYNNCWDILDKSKTKPITKTEQLEIQNLISVLNYLGYLGLITSRYAIKTQSSVTNYYSRVATKNFNNIFAEKFVWITPPPHSKSIQSISQVFTKGSSAFTNYLTLELKLYKYMLMSEDSKMGDLLLAGNLLHFKFNGMLLINVASKLCLLTNLTLGGLVEATSYSEFEVSLLRLIHVSNNYLCSQAAKVEPLFPWCRLLDDKYMTSLSAEPNKSILDLWLTAISDIDNNPDVWTLYPWNGNQPTNQIFRTWTENIKRKITTSTLTPINDVASGNIEVPRHATSQEQDFSTSASEGYREI